MDKREHDFATLKVGDLCFDIPIEVIEKSKPFNLDCVVDVGKIKGGVEDLKHMIAINKDNVLENMKFLSDNYYELYTEYMRKLKGESE